MKTRDSGMPNQEWWESFFDPDAVLDALGLHQFDGPVIDVGCGYGTFTFTFTFTLAAARRTTHPVIAIDIESVMVDFTATKARLAGLDHIQCRLADVTEEALGVEPASAAVVLLFNLLHCEDPTGLLISARAALRPGCPSMHVYVVGRAASSQDVLRIPWAAPMVSAKPGLGGRGGVAAPSNWSHRPYLGIAVAWPRHPRCPRVWFANISNRGGVLQTTRPAVPDEVANDVQASGRPSFVLTNRNFVAKNRPVLLIASP